MRPTNPWLSRFRLPRPFEGDPYATGAAQQSCLTGVQASFIPALRRDLHHFTGMQFVVTSHIRRDGSSHRSGLSVDLAARSGRLWEAIKRRDGSVNYYQDRQLLSDIRTMLRQRASYHSCLRRIVLELDHIHVDLRRAPQPWKRPKLFIYDAPRCNTIACNPGGMSPFLKGPL